MTTPASRHDAGPAHGLPLRGWLLDRLSCYLHRPQSAIDPAVPLAEYGMDSVCSLSLCGDLEEQFGLEVDQTLLWDHPTVQSLLGHLEGVLAPAGAERC